MPLTPRLAALRGRGGGAPLLLPIAAGDVVREGATGGVDGLESGRGMLEGVSVRSMRSEVRMDERSGGAGKLEEEEVLAWTGVTTEEGATARGEEGTAVVEEETVVVEEEMVEEGTVVVEEGTVVVEEETVVVLEEGTVVEAVETVWVFVGLSILE